MAHHRSDVLAHAVALLDAHGLAALTMRRLGAELGVQPSAIYHHFPSKQALLAAVADEILARGARPRTAAAWPDRLREVCSELRHAMLGCTDGADVVATVWAFGLGAAAPVVELEKVLADADVPAELVPVASRALVHYVFGHAFEEQTARQAVGLGAVDRSLESLPDFDLGLDLVVDGLRARLAGS
ncbi:TetR family transcriptional regulator [Nocardioides renjunii]|uniref:TetR family transcriptional regulator n=1 Tax=Nocardioides renjunii TaxID=3095075 RepID=UPI002AFF8C9E|nr:TetR family transcriptional regulator [Nocardioides sp. S-34]WQQ21064.1 TetR family transcriptional regulator [Nocardioides sp. S-34]